MICHLCKYVSQIQLDCQTNLILSRMVFYQTIYSKRQESSVAAEPGRLLPESGDRQPSADIMVDKAEENRARATELAPGPLSQREGQTRSSHLLPLR